MKYIYLRMVSEFNRGMLNGHDPYLISEIFDIHDVIQNSVNFRRHEVRWKHL